MKPKEKACVISLGCAKNLVDSEHILGWLAEREYLLVGDLEQADVAIVNTCGFLQSAVEEAIRTILEVSERKRKGRLRKLFVVGCLVQRYGYKLSKEMPEVDGWAGPGEIHRITELLQMRSRKGPPFLINRPMFLPDHRTPRVQSTPPHTAYLKIAEGCSHRCTFCIIPQLRGPLRSRTLESLVEETMVMAERGVKEVNLIAQDTTMYGRDLAAGYGLEDLVERLVQVRGLSWIRILYSHPEGITDRLLELMGSPSPLCPYLDIPIQHVDAGILRAMGRGLDEARVRKLIGKIRSRYERISLRTTVMVGFPGETKAAFERLLGFVKETEFDHLGAFAFSPERGTSADRMRNQVSPPVAERRRDRIMRVQAKISKRKNEARIGQVYPVLVEEARTGRGLRFSGRTAFMAPEVDGTVLIRGGIAEVGTVKPVKITRAGTYDLTGEWV
ncbi:MAG: 30S ribosomal protein S12 methylthiotransferase RimO [Deltaproteobacteria bacterium]